MHEHLMDLIIKRRQELQAAWHQAELAGEQVEPPTDLLGALVAAQLDTERSSHGVGDSKQSVSKLSTGLTFEETVGSCCELHCMYVTRVSAE